jgi:hypothetical protein
MALVTRYPFDGAAGVASTFVFERGEAITIDPAGNGSVAFEAARPVVSNGGSEFVFENGTGIGGGGAGTVVEDTVGDRNLSVRGGEAVAVSGVNGGGIDFGGEAYLNSTADGVYLPTLETSYSISVLLKISEFVNDIQQVIEMSAPDYGGRDELRIEFTNSSVNFHQDLDDGTILNIDAGWSATPGEWHHLAMVYEADQLRGYIDGTEYTTGSVGGGTPINEHNGEYQIAVDIGKGPYQFLHGALDDLRIRDDALSTNEVNDLYASYGLD